MSTAEHALDRLELYQKGREKYEEVAKDPDVKDFLAGVALCWREILSDIKATAEGPNAKENLEAWRPVVKVLPKHYHIELLREFSHCTPSKLWVLDALFPKKEG